MTTIKNIYVEDTETLRSHSFNWFATSGVERRLTIICSTCKARYQSQVDHHLNSLCDLIRDEMYENLMKERPSPSLVFEWHTQLFKKDFDFLFQSNVHNAVENYLCELERFFQEYPLSFANLEIGNMYCATNPRYPYAENFTFEVICLEARASSANKVLFVPTPERANPLTPLVEFGSSYGFDWIFKKLHK